MNLPELVSAACGLFLVINCVIINGQPETDPEGYRLGRHSSYVIVAPEAVHPYMIYQMSVSITSIYTENVIVKASIRRNNEEQVAEGSLLFSTTGTQLLQLWVPENAEPGNYSLKVEGLTDRHSGALFDNETHLEFNAKQSSVFIQMNKALYRQSQKVKFRVFPTFNNLMSRSGSMDVYVVDSTGNTVRRWLSMQTNAGGVLDMEFDLSDQPNYGEWKVKVYSFGYWYEEPFRVNEFFYTAIDVNVTMSPHSFADEFAIGGIITANLSLGQPVVGLLTVTLDILDPPGINPNASSLARLEIPSSYFPGVKGFQFLMADVKAALPSGQSIANKELKVVAEVYDWYRNERATGSGITVVYEDTLVFEQMGDLARTFKPNQTLNVYFAVSHRDGTPISIDRRQVTVTRTEEGSGHFSEQQIYVADNGIAHYRFTAGEQATFITVRAFYDNYQSNVIEVRFSRHFTPSESYLYITTTTYDPQVNEYMLVTVTTTPYVPLINYVIASSGNIITGEALVMSSRQRTFGFAITREMLPESHLVVWFVRYGEVVADALNFYVNGTRMNPVHILMNKGKDFSGDTVELTTWTDPSSFVGFSGCGWPIWIYGWCPFITEDKVIDEMGTYDLLLGNTSFAHRFKRPGTEEFYYVHYPSDSYGVDSNQTFSYAGLIVFTDANVTRVYHHCNVTLGFHPCMDGSCYEDYQRCDGHWNCRDGQDEMGCSHLMEKKSIFTPVRDRLGLLTRHYVQLAHWVWTGHFVMPNGRLDLTLSVPDEPITWMISAFGISRDLGFGFLPEPALHDATRPFFMRIEAAQNAVKGEQLGIRVGLFNYFLEDLETLVTLLDSDQYKFIIVEEFGIVSSYNPRTIRGNIQTMVYIENGEWREIFFPVLPVVDGCIMVKVKADAFVYGDYQEIEICTRYDGVTNYLNIPYFVDLVNSGSMVLPDLEIPVPERFVKPEERKHLYVPGSPISTVGLVGDVVGVGIYQKHLTTDDLLRKPFGSVEQSLFNFGYLLHNLLYLRYTNQLTTEMMVSTMYDLNLYFQRLQGYYSTNGIMGYFSMYRDYTVPTPTTWVTASILQAYAKSQERDWELEFFMPTELLNNITMWLCSKQRADGAFIDDAPDYDIKFTSNQTTPTGNKANYALTAFVLIALAKSTRVTGLAETCRIDAIASAVTYLETYFIPLPDHEQSTYQLALVTYALHLAPSSTFNQDAFAKFNSRKYDTHYWADYPIPPNEVVFIDGQPYYQTRKWYDNEGYGVETTSYGLLIYLLKNMRAEALGIMKWLHTMRNTMAGQASTKDSLAALEALVEFARMDANRDIYNVEVTVEATSMGNWSTKVHLYKDNWPNLQKVNIYPVWGTVRGRAQGTGMVMMQLFTTYNVEYPHQQEPPEFGRWFDVYIDSLLTSGKNFSTLHYTVCARYVRPDFAPHSGMAVLEIHIPTGYVITNNIMRAYAQSHVVPGLQAAEYTDGKKKINFYFDYIGTNTTCVQFRVDRWYPVANMTIQHLLKVYEFYEPAKRNSSMYNTFTLFNLHICQVCGSFQCPYCKYYNSSSVLRPTTWIIAFIALILTMTMGNKT